MSKLEGFNCDESIKSDLIETIEHVSNSIKSSHELNLIQLKKVNPSAHQTQEACDRIKKGKQKADEDAAHTLLNMLNNSNESSTKINVQLPAIKDKHAKNLQIPDFIESPSPKNSPSCKPHEAWGMLNVIKLNLGEKVCKYVKTSSINELIKKSDDNACLVPVSLRSMLRCIDKPKDQLEEDWDVKGRKRQKKAEKGLRVQMMQLMPYLKKLSQIRAWAHQKKAHLM